MVFEFSKIGSFKFPYSLGTEKGQMPGVCPEKERRGGGLLKV